MNEKPILFKGEMVRAIMDGRKNQTRRVIKPVPGDRKHGGFIMDSTDRNRRSGDAFFYRGDDVVLGRDNLYARCPFGTIGTTIWVRETFAFWDTFNDRKPSQLCGNPGVEYKAGGTNLHGGSEPHLTNRGKWRPSIFMPRWASRITLEVKGVRVERVQDISARDAKAEGDKERSGFLEYHNMGDKCHIVWFRGLWNSINATPKPVESKGEITHYVSYPWEDSRETREHRGLLWYVYGNPWLWVLDFERID